MHRGNATVRRPRLASQARLALGGASSVGIGERDQYAEVGSRESIEVADRSHADVHRSPRANALEGYESGLGRLGVGTRGEVDTAGGDEFGNRAQGIAARVWQTA